MKFVKQVLTFLIIALAVLSISVPAYFAGILKGSQFNINITNPFTRFSVTQSPQGTPASVKYIAPQKPTWTGPELWEAVNTRRKELGVNPLSTKEELCTIASIRLNELLDLGKLDAHEGFTSLPERRPELKWIYEKYTLTEFLLSGAESPQEAVSLWENTLGHSKLLNGGEYVWGCIYAQNGFAVAITAY